MISPFASVTPSFLEPFVVLSEKQIRINRYVRIQMKIRNKLERTTSLFAQSHIDNMNTDANRIAKTNAHAHLHVNDVGTLMVNKTKKRGIPVRFNLQRNQMHTYDKNEIAL